MMFTAIKSVFLAEIVGMIEWWRQHGWGGQKKLSEERGDFQLLCLSAYPYKPRCMMPWQPAPCA
jgi:hypothetical protein